ncbi:MAG: hypothetical protein U9M97_03770 [Candidatus Hadarchaeota archaeon]|nr:hypothetical protein [Candidatus Hadarchaeota archaeon]
MRIGVLAGIVALTLAVIVAAITLIPTEEGAEVKTEAPTWHVGDEWLYRVTDDITYAFHYEVVGEEVMDNKGSYVIEESHDPPYLGISSEETSWIEKATGDTMKMQMSGIYFGDPYEKTVTFTNQYIGPDKWPVETGKEYLVIRTKSYTTSPGGPTGTEERTTTVRVERRENITVPAGTFTCFKIVNYDENDNILSTKWYSEDVRQYVKTVNNETRAIWELVSYSIEEETLAISGPMELEVGDEAAFTVTSRSSPVENAFVEFGGTIKKTSADGTVTFAFDQPGDFTITATREGCEKAPIPVTVKALPENAPHYEVAACANRIDDGDTFEAGILKLVTELDSEGEIYEGAWERARFGGGIDAPEIWSHTPPLSGEPGAVEAMRLIENLIPLHTPVYLDLNDLSEGGETGRPYRGTYERLITVIYTVIDGRWVNINAELLRWGMDKYPEFDWLKYTYFPSEWDPYEWLEENYPYVRN